MIKMKIHTLLIGVFALIVSPLSLFAQKGKNQKEESALFLHFHHLVGDQPLVLDDSIYVNSLEQTFTISKFNYYIGEIQLTSVEGKVTKINEYFLLSEDEEKQQSKNIPLSKISPGSYTSLRFIVGVDSSHNCSGAQKGDLDPINAMFWTWNTGYIFLKLEGKSSFSSQPGNSLEYHIGGYKEPANCVREVALNFRQPLVITQKTKGHVDLKVDLLELLKTPIVIDFTVLPTVNNTLNATLIANNYQDMFSIIDPENEK
jgi:hypothetical protein